MIFLLFFITKILNISFQYVLIAISSLSGIEEFNELYSNQEEISIEYMKGDGEVERSVEDVTKTCPACMM